MLFFLFHIPLYFLLVRSPNNERSFCYCVRRSKIPLDKRSCTHSARNDPENSREFQTFHSNSDENNSNGQIFGRMERNRRRLFGINLHTMSERSASAGPFEHRAAPRTLTRTAFAWQSATERPQSEGQMFDRDDCWRFIIRVFLLSALAASHFSLALLFFFSRFTASLSPFLSLNYFCYLRRLCAALPGCKAAEAETELRTVDYCNTFPLPSLSLHSFRA